MAVGGIAGRLRDFADAEPVEPELDDHPEERSERRVEGDDSEVVHTQHPAAQDCKGERECEGGDMGEGQLRKLAKSVFHIAFVAEGGFSAKGAGVTALLPQIEQVPRHLTRANLVAQAGPMSRLATSMKLA